MVSQWIRNSEGWDYDDEYSSNGYSSSWTLAEEALEHAIRSGHVDAYEIRQKDEYSVVQSIAPIFGQIDWSGNQGFPFLAVSSVAVDLKGLRSWFSKMVQLRRPPTEPIQDLLDARPEQVSPFLRFMLDASKRLGVHEGDTRKKPEIEDWLQENWPQALGEITDNKRKLMATFLRWPHHEKGGNRSQGALVRAQRSEPSSEKNDE